MIPDGLGDRGLSFYTACGLHCAAHFTECNALLKPTVLPSTVKGREVPLWEARRTAYARAGTLGPTPFGVNFLPIGPIKVNWCGVAQVSTSPAPYAELLLKVFDLTGRGLSRPLAESLLSLNFPESDAIRAAELNEKANEGSLTDAEREELQVYANIADLLAYWQLKAEQALQQNS